MSVYESHVEKALLEWLPGDYLGKLGKSPEIHRQVHLPNGGRADILVYADLSTPDVGHVALDIWKISLGPIGVEALAHALSWRSSIRDLYSRICVAKWDEGFEDDHVFSSNIYVVGSEVQVPDILLQHTGMFVGFWTYRMSAGRFTFTFHSPKHDSVKADPPLLQRLMAPLRWKPHGYGPQSKQSQ